MSWTDKNHHGREAIGARPHNDAAKHLYFENCENVAAAIPDFLQAFAFFVSHHRGFIRAARRAKQYAAHAILPAARRKERFTAIIFLEDSQLKLTDEPNKSRLGRQLEPRATKHLVANWLRVMTTISC